MAEGSLSTPNGGHLTLAGILGLWMRDERSTDIFFLGVEAPLPPIAPADGDDDSMTTSRVLATSSSSATPSMTSGLVISSTRSTNSSVSAVDSIEDSLEERDRPPATTTQQVQRHA